MKTGNGGDRQSADKHREAPGPDQIEVRSDRMPVQPSSKPSPVMENGEWKTERWNGGLFHLPPSSVHFSILLAAHRPVDAAFELLSVPAARAGIGRVERHRRAGLTADARLPALKSAGIESRRWRPRRARPSRRDRRTGRGTAAPPAPTRAPTAAPSSPAPAGARATRGRRPGFRRADGPNAAPGSARSRRRWSGAQPGVRAPVRRDARPSSGWPPCRGTRENGTGSPRGDRPRER